MIALIELSLVVLIIEILVVHHFGLAFTAAANLLVSTAIVPRVFFYLDSEPPDPTHVGIAPSTLALSTYLLSSLLFGMLLSAKGVRGTGIALWAPVATWIAVAFVWLWPRDDAVRAGVLALATGPFAWLIGAHTARLVLGARASARRIQILVSLIVGLQFSVVVLQWLGLVPSGISGRSAEILAGRFAGTLFHPNDLGKVLVALLTIVLVVAAQDRGLLRVSKLTIGFGVLALLLTGGRAVTLGFVLIVLTFVYLLPNTINNVRRKVLWGFYGVAVVGLIWMALSDRFTEDPAGGDRSVLVDTAITQISRGSPWGVGPNRYVVAVGEWDQLTASGVPVHNVFLLAISELGWIGAGALLLPFVAGIFRGLANFRSRSASGVFARALLASAPGFLLIGATGWGLLGGYVFPLTVFVWGFLYVGAGSDVSQGAGQDDEPKKRLHSQ